VAKVLRETGYMRELGEGVRRMFELMKQNELTAPEIESTSGMFMITLRHEAVYSHQEKAWLEQFSRLQLDREQKAVVVLGRTGALIAPQDIRERLGIVDTEDYRKIVKSLQDYGILQTAIRKDKASQIARGRSIPVSRVARFRVVPPAAERESEPAGARDAQSAELVVPDESMQICVLNLPWDITREQILEYFQVFGEVDEIVVPSRNGRGLGYAFVQFTEGRVALSVLDDPPHAPLQGRTPAVQKAHPRRARARLTSR
jgi:ATP-dependent DNA helicase RecG